MYLRMEPPNALAVFATMCLMLATIGRAEHCPLPGTECRPDGPWPQTKCTQLLNQTACEKAITTPTCNPKGSTYLPYMIGHYSTVQGLNLLAFLVLKQNRIPNRSLA